MIYDIAIVGGGPAGWAASLNARRRNKQTVVIGKEAISSKLAQAHRVDNYPGLPLISGSDLAVKMREHAENNGALFIKDEIQNIFRDGDRFALFGREQQLQALSVILAVGIGLNSGIKGEDDFVGRGVSYCATCDGMFFKDKPVAVLGYIREAEAEVNFLAQICSAVYYLPLYKNPAPFDTKVTRIDGKPLAITGGERVEALTTSSGQWKVDGIFIERSGRPADQLLDNLKTEDGLIVVDGNQATNIPGVFAAGDCTGKPWQISRATGQGQVAALSAVHYLENLEK